MRVAHLSVGFATHIGLVRNENEDHFAVYLPEEPEALAERGNLLIVADGMGGHAAGSLASQLAVDAFLRDYYWLMLGRCPEAALRAAFEAANARVLAAAREHPAQLGMGTTMTALVVRGDELWVGHAGDSRAYLFRGGHLEQLTVDHTLAQVVIAEHPAAEVDSAEWAEAESAILSSPLAHQLTRCIGSEVGAEPDLLRRELRSGDVVLAATDGLTGPVPDREIEEVLRLERSPSVTAHVLVDRALSHGGPDNITVVLARVDRLEE